MSGFARLTLRSGRRCATDRVQALNARDVLEHAASGVADGGHQQPGDGLGIRGVDLRHRFAGDLAAIPVCRHVGPAK